MQNMFSCFCYHYYCGCYAGGGSDSSRPKSFAMLSGDVTSDIASDMRPRSDSLPDQSATVGGSKRKSILKKEALNREEMEGLLRSSRNSFAGTPGRSAAVTADNLDDDDDDQLVVRHLPRLSGADDGQPRRVHPPCDFPRRTRPSYD